LATNHFTSRAKAQAAIKAGHVIDVSTGLALTKPSMRVSSDIVLQVNEDALPFVSRGGIKLAAALAQFEIDCTGKIVLDIGASTGGFTDVVLQNGATFVYALDVGTDQLVESLRADTRVLSLEQTNFRYITREIFTVGLPRLIVADVSFISLTFIFDKLAALFVDEAFTFVGLIKPQFELAKRKIGKKGVVRDKKQQQEAITKIKNYVVAQGKNWRVVGVMPSPITGTKGNQEFLIYVEKVQ